MVIRSFVACADKSSQYSIHDMIVTLYGWTFNFHRIQVRWKILFYRIPQFLYESKSERIIEIGPHLPLSKLS